MGSHRQRCWPAPRGWRLLSPWRVVRLALHPLSATAVMPGRSNSHAHGQTFVLPVAPETSFTSPLCGAESTASIAARVRQRKTQGKTKVSTRAKRLVVVGGSLLSLSLLFSSLFLFSLPALVVSLSSLSNNDNDHSSSRALSLSLCTHGSDLPECSLDHSLFGRTCSYQKNCASLVPLGMKWTCICVAKG